MIKNNIATNFFGRYYLHAPDKDFIEAYYNSNYQAFLRGHYFIYKARKLHVGLSADTIHKPLENAIRKQLRKAR